MQIWWWKIWLNWDNKSFGTLFDVVEIINKKKGKTADILRTFHWNFLFIHSRDIGKIPAAFMTLSSSGWLFVYRQDRG